MARLLLVLLAGLAGCDSFVRGCTLVAVPARRSLGRRHLLVPARPDPPHRPARSWPGGDPPFRGLRHQRRLRVVWIHLLLVDTLRGEQGLAVGGDLLNEALQLGAGRCEAMEGEAFDHADRRVALRPDVPEYIRDRGWMRIRVGLAEAGAFDLARYLDMVPDAEDASALRWTMHALTSAAPMA